MTEATIAHSPRTGFGIARSVAALVKPPMKRTAARLWVDDMAYAERRYLLRARGDVYGPPATRREFCVARRALTQGGDRRRSTVSRSSAPSRGRGRAGPTGTGGGSPPSSRSSPRAPSGPPGSRSGSRRRPADPRVRRADLGPLAPRLGPDQRAVGADQPLLVDDVRRVELGVQVAQLGCAARPAAPPRRCRRAGRTRAPRRRCRAGPAPTAAAPASNWCTAETLSSGPKPLVARNGGVPSRTGRSNHSRHTAKDGAARRDASRVRHASSPSQGEPRRAAATAVWSVASTTASASTAEPSSSHTATGPPRSSNRRRGHRHDHPHPEVVEVAAERRPQRRVVVVVGHVEEQPLGRAEEVGVEHRDQLAAGEVPRVREERPREHLEREMSCPVREPELVEHLRGAAPGVVVVGPRERDVEQPEGRVDVDAGEVAQGEAGAARHERHEVRAAAAVGSPAKESVCPPARTRG